MNAKTSLPDQPSLLIGTPEAARLLGISRKTCWSMAKHGKLPSLRIGTRRLYSREALRCWIAASLASQPEVAQR